MKADFVAQPWNDGSSLDDWFAGVAAWSGDSPVAITIVTAWAKRSGLNLIQRDLETIRSAGGTVDLIAGISEGGATRQGLEQALASCNSVSIFHDISSRTFHPKVYLAKKAGEARLLVGSHNLTAGGVFRNYEAGIALTLDTDSSVVRAVEAWIAQLRADAACCVVLDTAVLGLLVAQAFYRIGDEDRDRHRRSASGAVSASGDDRLFLSSSTRKKGPRGAQPKKPSSGEGDDGGVGSLGTAPIGTVERSWSKLLKRSDAQQMGGTGKTNLTGALRLTTSGHSIDRTTYFRYEFFGAQVWQQDPEKPKVDFAMVPMEVSVRGQSLGMMDFRIDHDLGREADQNNFTTVLKWGPMNGLLRAHSYVDDWVLLEQLTDGYRLSIVVDDPKAAGA